MGYLGSVLSQSVLTVYCNLTSDSLGWAATVPPRQVSQVPVLLAGIQLVSQGGLSIVWCGSI